MTFSDEQKKMLDAKLNPERVSERSQAGRALSYIEGWWAISEANRIFGFDGWDSEIMQEELLVAEPCQLGKPPKTYPGFTVSYKCRVRIHAGGRFKDGAGVGHGKDRDLGLAHESALKEAETDAIKRALIKFGNPFGLALYDKSRANVGIDEDAQRRAQAEQWTDATLKKVKSADLGWLNGLENSGAYEKLETAHPDLHAKLAKACDRKREELNGMQAPPPEANGKANGLPKKPQTVNGEAAHG
jgi:DNA recombination protein Rad52